MSTTRPTTPAPKGRWHAYFSATHDKTHGSCFYLKEDDTEIKASEVCKRGQPILDNYCDDLEYVGIVKKEGCKRGTKVDWITFWQGSRPRFYHNER
jgi:hypothetical protein